MKFVKSLSLIVVIAAAAAGLWSLVGPSTSAGATSYFNYTDHLMDDAVFRDTGTMSVSDIQNLLQNKGSGLAGFSDVEDCGSTSGAHYSYYATYYSCGSSVKASKIIYDAAHAYGINPQAILATLQKEQSLITTPNPTSSQLNYAMGYGCPDSGGCGYAGFFNQVDNGTWQFRTDMELGSGNNWWGYTPASYPCNGPTRYYSQALKAGNNVGFYDDYGNDYANFILPNMATATLYCYTPHVYPGSSQEFYSGSKNFVYYFTLWFVPYDYQFVTSSASALHYNPGGTGTVTIVIQNTGFTNWYSDHNLPSGQPYTRLATINYQDSPFITADNNSLFTHNQVLMTPDVVQPGQNATFTFDVTGPYQVMTSHTHLVPIIGGAFLKDIGMDAVLNADIPDWQLNSSSIDTPTPAPNQLSLAHFSVLNKSGATWYSDHNLPSGQQPTRLATIGFQNSPFADTQDPNWLGTRNQIMMTPDTVAPGQTAHFDAYFIGPITSSAVSSAFHFHPVVGSVQTDDKGCTFSLNTPAANMSYQFVTSSGVPATMAAGSKVTASVTIKNTGNVIWQDESVDNRFRALRLMFNHPNYRNSAFYDSSDINWLTASQIAKPAGVTMPGQSTTFTFSWKAPSQTGNYYEPFAPIIAGNFMQDIGMAINISVQ